MAALCELPPEVRDPIAETQAAADAAPLELRLASLQLLERDGSAKLGGLCRRLWRRVHAQAPAVVSAQQRQLAFAALQAQPQLGADDVGELSAWLDTIKTEPRADADLVVRIRELASSLVDDVADTLKPAQVEGRIEAVTYPAAGCCRPGRR